jgi:K+-transporting ATPase KdpF subunit
MFADGNGWQGERRNERLHHIGQRDSIRDFVMAAPRALQPVDGRQAMSSSEWIAFALTLGLMAYLVVALLKPEWFA